MKATGQKSNVYCVLGMHRSGTSCLAGIIKASGVEFGDVVTSAPHNKKGNQENLEIRAVNDEVLAENGGTWDNPVDVVTWTEEQAGRRDRIIAQFESLGAARWAFKDPRTVFTLPFWRDGISALKLIGSVRHPVLVAKSLAARDHIALPQGLMLWERYNRRILEEWRHAPFSIIRFDQPQELYLAAVSRVLEEIRCEKKDLSFFDLALVHESSDGGEQLPLAPRAREVWDALAAIAGSRNPAAVLAGSQR